MNPFDLSRAEGHLRLLKIFHFVYGGLTVLALGFLALHYFVMTSFMKMAPPQVEPVERASANAPVMTEPDFEQIMGMMIWFYVAIGAFCVLIGGLNILSALWMGSRKHRIFSIIVGGVNCLNIPLGTVLGVFTIVFLTKPAALALYGESEMPLSNS